MLKRISLAALSLLLCFSALPNVVFALESGEEQLHLANEFIEVAIQKDSGRFSIKTKQGSPVRESDAQAPLLYEGEYPETSFTTFRVNGEDYIYGNDYGFMDVISEFTTHPVNEGLLNQSTWHLNGLEISQSITLVNDHTNPDVGNVKISYSVHNATHEDQEVGTRILLDTMLGPEDGSPITVPGHNEFIHRETMIDGPLPTYWRAVDNPLAPKVISYGLLSGWGNTSADQMVIAHWNSLAETKWDVEIDPSLDFTSTRNSYGSADSAIALYWHPAVIQAGETKTYETYYGLGSLYTSEQQALYHSQVFAPTQLTLNEERDGYVEQPFSISIEIDNTSSDAVPLSQVEVKLGLPIELELFEGEQQTQTIGSIRAGEIKTVTWQVMPVTQYIFKAAQFLISVNALGMEERLHADFVVMPAISGLPPEVQVLNTVPSKLYNLDKNKSVLVVGTGFDALRGRSDLQASLMRESDQYTTDIPSGNIAISDDRSISIQLDDQVWGPEDEVLEGKYILMLDAGAFGRFEQTVEITKESKYMPRNYGVLAIVGDENQTYQIVPLENEAMLQHIEKDPEQQILLEFRGDIQERTDDGHQIFEIGSGATINSLIHYERSDMTSALYGELSQKIVIQKVNDAKKPHEYIDISGNGVLSIPSSPFHYGQFNIQIQDEKEYKLDGEREERITINWEVIQGLGVTKIMSNLPVEIRSAVLGKQDVAFGGKLSINFDIPSKNKKTEEQDDEEKEKDKDEDRELAISLDVDEVKFGIHEKSGPYYNAGEFGFMGFRVEGEAGIPKGIVPGLDLGVEGRVLIDTIDHIYEIETDVSFKVIEVHGLFRLRFTEDAIPIPDNFELIVGGMPGIPLIPTAPVAYIVRGGGGIQNLYDTVMGNYNVLPPLRMFVVGGVSVANVITADHATFGISLRGVDFKTELEIMKIPILKEVSGKLTFEDSLEKFASRIELGAKVEVFEIIKGKVYAVLSYDSSRNGLLGPVSLTGGGEVDIVVPNSIPLIGGKKAAGAKLEISTERLYAKTHIIGIPASIEYIWGESAPRFVSLMQMDEAGTSSGLMQQHYYDEETYRLSATMAFGRNIREVASSSRRSAQAMANNASLVTLASYGSETAEVAISNQDIALIEISYSGDVPHFIVRDPAGKVYELEQDVNYLTQHIPADVSQSGTLEQRAYISIQQPMNGVWKVESDQPIDWTLLDVAIPPTIKNVSVTPTGDSNAFNVHWDVEHGEGKALAIYLSGDAGHDAGRLLLDGLHVGDGQARISLPDTFASGEYYIRAVVYDNETSYDSMYSANKVSIINEYEPSVPKNVQSSAVGDGVLHVQWDMEEEVDGFYIDILNENGDVLEQMGIIEIDGDQREVYAGGIPVAESYQVGVTAYRTVKEATVYSQTALSNTQYLPEPEPAQLMVNLISDNGQTLLHPIVDESGLPAYLINRSEVLIAVQANQEVEADVFINEEWFGSYSGNEWDDVLILQEGVNLVHLYAVNEQGDSSSHGLRIIVDTMAPDLKIESIESHTSTTGESVIRIDGVAELNSKVSVNGTPVTFGEKGMFTGEVPVDDVLTMPVVVIAEDQAGNQTIYETEKANERITTFKRVEIRPIGFSGSHDQFELGVNRTQRFQLFGIDMDERAFLIDDEQVNWEVLIGDAHGTISEDGSLYVNHTGKLSIVASYAISRDYALEDAYVINVIQSDDELDEQQPGRPNYDDWYEPATNDQGGSSGTMDPIEAKFQSILRNIIQYEQSLQFVTSAVLSSDETTVIAIDRFAQIIIDKQQLDGEVGVGVGIVTNAEPYLRDHLDFIGEIYHIEASKPLQLAPLATFITTIDANQLQRDGSIALYWYNDREQRWEYIGSDIDPTERAMRAKLPSLGKVALVRNKEWTPFADINGRWSQDIVRRLASIHIIDGLESDGMMVYEPSRDITRQEFIKLMVSMSGVDLAQGDLPTTFADRDEVPNWAAPYMEKALQLGWISGSLRDGQLHLDPERPISRAEAATIAGRLLAGVASTTDGKQLDFVDMDDIPHWSNQHIKLLSEHSIIQGYPDGMFRPSNQLTREEAAAIVLNMIDFLYDGGNHIE